MDSYLDKLYDPNNDNLDVFNFLKLYHNKLLQPYTINDHFSKDAVRYLKTVIYEKLRKIVDDIEFIYGELNVIYGIRITVDWDNEKLDRYKIDRFREKINRIRIDLTVFNSKKKDFEYNDWLINLIKNELEAENAFKDDKEILIDILKIDEEDKANINRFLFPNIITDPKALEYIIEKYIHNYSKEK